MECDGIGELVTWSPSGECYAVATGAIVTVYRISDSSETCVISCPKAILSMDFLTEDILILGGEIEEVMIYSIKNQSTLQTFKAHDSRVKSLKATANPNDAKHAILFSVSSDGKLRAWDIDIENIQSKPFILAEFHIPGRPVCMAVIPDPSK